MQKTSFVIGIIEPLASTSVPLLSILPALLEMGYTVRILATGTKQSGDICLKLMEQYPKQCELLEALNTNRETIVQQADVLVYTQTPQKSDWRAMMKHNTVAVVPEGGYIQNYNAQAEKGEGFTFIPGNQWSLLRALVRAEETHNFSYDWRNIIKRLKAHNKTKELLV